LPLSGGADSGATAAIVASMARMVFNQIQEDGQGESETLLNLRKVTQKPDFSPKSY
jgi:hypothetical protein